jgi:tol-pal system protein YbgF
MKRQTILVAVGLAILSIILFSAPSQAGKNELEAIQKLQAEVTVMQRQVRDLQQSFDRSTGQIVTLIGQMTDNVATATRSIAAMQEAISDTQARIQGNFTRVESRFTALETNLKATSDRLTHINDQIAGVKEVIAQLQQKSQRSIDPTDPVQLFSSAYSDYLRGNYELAIDQFTQFRQRFPGFETADDAQFWIAECLSNTGRLDEAVAQYENVVNEYPQSNKVAAARLKKGLALLQLKRQAEAVAELRLAAKSSPDSVEAISAKQRLEQLGVPLEEPKKPKQVRPTQRRKPK